MTKTFISLLQSLNFFLLLLIVHHYKIVLKLAAQRLIPFIC